MEEQDNAQMETVEVEDQQALEGQNSDRPVIELFVKVSKVQKHTSPKHHQTCHCPHCVLDMFLS